VARHACVPETHFGVQARGVKGKALLQSSAPTSRHRILAGADEEAQGRVEERWRAGACPEPVEGFWLHLFSQKKRWKTWLKQ